MGANHDAGARSVIIELGFKVLVVIVTGLVGWLARGVMDHEIRLAHIEASRFTRDDGAEMIRLVDKGLHDLSIKFSRLEVKFDELKARFDKLGRDR